MPALRIEDPKDPEVAIEQIAKLFEESQTILEERAIKAAIAKRVLHVEEESFARGLIRDHGLATFTAFLTHRKKQPFCVIASPPEEAETQAKINRQFGLSPEVFAKYNSIVR